MARSCNVATDRLVYQDIRGLSAKEPCLKGRIWGCTKPKDAGLLLGRAYRDLGLVWCQWMAGTVNVTLARANGAGPGLIPSKSGIKAYRLYPMGIGPTPKRLQSKSSPQLLGVL